MKVLLIIIIGLLIFFFCPVILIGAGLVLFGGIFLLGLGIVAIAGLLRLLAAAATDPTLARKCGLGAMIAYVIIAVFRRIPGLSMSIAMRGGGMMLVASDVALAVAGYFAACMLLAYLHSAPRNEMRTGRLFAGYLFTVLGAILDIGATCFALYAGMYGSGDGMWVLFTLASCVLPLIGLLLLLAQKPQDGTAATPEEGRGIRLFALGLVISLVLRILTSLIYAGGLPGALSRVTGYAGYLPLVLAVVGLVMLLTAKPAKAETAPKRS